MRYWISKYYLTAQHDNKHAKKIKTTKTLNKKKTSCILQSQALKQQPFKIIKHSKPYTNEIYSNTSMQNIHKSYWHIRNIQISCFW